MTLIPAPHGQLEGLWRDASPARAREHVALMCHPHPLHGGTMHTKAVHATCKGLQEAGVANFTFNFRGVGRSSGAYDGGVGERKDAHVALDHVAERRPGAPQLVGGMSFGSWVGLSVGASQPDVAGLIALAPPFARYDFDFLRESDKPKVILQGDADELTPLEDAEAMFEAMRPPRLLVIFEGTGHLFLEALPELRETVAALAANWPPSSGRLRVRPGGA